jgi:hypothetical protein
LFANHSQSCWGGFPSHFMMFRTIKGRALHGDRIRRRRRSPPARPYFASGPNLGINPRGTPSQHHGGERQSRWDKAPLAKRSAVFAIRISNVPGSDARFFCRVFRNPGRRLSVVWRSGVGTKPASGGTGISRCNGFAFLGCGIASPHRNSVAGQKLARRRPRILATGLSMLHKINKGEIAGASRRHHPCPLWSLPKVSTPGICGTLGLKVLLTKLA